MYVELQQLPQLVLGQMNITPANMPPHYTPQDRNLQGMLLPSEKLDLFFGTPGFYSLMLDV